MKCLIKIFLFFILFTHNIHSSEYYENVFLGEGEIEDYSGIYSPDVRYSDTSGKLYFIDRDYQNNYTENAIEDNFFDLYDLWLNELPEKSSCPNFFIDENHNYIRYMFRLLSISYAYESLRSYNETMYELGMGRDQCSTSWKSVFEQCRPESNDMKMLLKRARRQISLIRGKLRKRSKKEKSEWLEEFQRKSRFKLIREMNSAETRLFLDCQPNSSCEGISYKYVEKILKKSCSEEKKIIQTVCSEKDLLFGLSYVENMVPILLKTNTFDLINKGNYGLNCLKRYAKLFSGREVKYPHLKYIFTNMYEKSKKSRYPFGRLFVSGALKEFDDKGLGDFLFVEPKKKPVVRVAVAKPKPVVVVKKKKNVEKKKKLPIKKVVKKKPKKVLEPKKTEFKIAYLKMKSTGSDQEIVNMAVFKNDYVFTKRVSNRLKNPLKLYQTRESLDSMKRIEKLGQKVEPLRLIFIKFLLDHNMHQGLYNIQMVIGKQFYLINDIDGLKDGPIPIELRNDESTGYQWVIVLLSEKYLESQKTNEQKEKEREERIEKNRIKYEERRIKERKERKKEELKRKRIEEKLREERLEKIRKKAKKKMY